MLHSRCSSTKGTLLTFPAQLRSRFHDVAFSIFWRVIHTADHTAGIMGYSHLQLAYHVYKGALTQVRTGLLFTISLIQFVLEYTPT